MEPSVLLQKGNERQLWWFVGLNIALFLAVLISPEPSLAAVKHFQKLLTAEDGFLGLCAPLVVPIMNAWLNANDKARLVFWRWKYPLPGCEAFSWIVKTDFRIDPAALKKRLTEKQADDVKELVVQLGEVINNLGNRSPAGTDGKRLIKPRPPNPAMQNALWYKLYRQYGELPRVKETHRLFLLHRDMVGLAAFFFAAFVPPVFLSSLPCHVCYAYCLWLVVQYLMLVQAARNEGEEFVANVLIEAAQPVLAQPQLKASGCDQGEHQ